MKDRVPQNPGRMLITPENGIAPYFAKVERADNPVEAGTPMNKATFLKDATASLYGLGQSAVPDDVLVKVKSSLNADSSAISSLNTSVSKMGWKLLASSHLVIENFHADMYLPLVVSEYMELFFVGEDLFSSSSDLGDVVITNRKSNNDVIRLAEWGGISRSSRERASILFSVPGNSMTIMLSVNDSGSPVSVCKFNAAGTTNKLEITHIYVTGTIYAYGKRK